MNHTPGPWKIADNLTKWDSLEIYVSPTNTLVAEIRDPEFLQETPERATEEATMRVNARLIAAAPDLVALAKHIDAMATDAYLIGHPEWVEITEEAQQALNRVKGVA